MKLERLRGRKIVARVQQKGPLWKGKHLHARYVYGYPRHPAAALDRPGVFVGTLGSTKLSKSAVERNRMRRRTREALRTSLKAMPDFPTVQLLILPRSSSLKCPFAEIQTDISVLLTFLHARNPQKA